MRVWLHTYVFGGCLYQVGLFGCVLTFSCLLFVFFLFSCYLSSCFLSSLLCYITLLLVYLSLFDYPINICALRLFVVFVNLFNYVSNTLCGQYYNCRKCICPSSIELTQLESLILLL